MWKAVKIPLQQRPLGVSWLSVDPSVFHFGTHQAEHLLGLRALAGVAVLITLESRISPVAQELQSDVSGQTIEKLLRLKTFTFGCVFSVLSARDAIDCVDRHNHAEVISEVESRHLCLRGVEHA